MQFDKNQKDLIAAALKFYAEHLDRAANEAFATSPEVGNQMYEAYMYEAYTYKFKAMKTRFVENRVHEASTVDYN